MSSSIDSSLKEIDNLIQKQLFSDARPCSRIATACFFTRRIRARTFVLRQLDDWRAITVR